MILSKQFEIIFLYILYYIIYKKHSSIPFKKNNEYTNLLPNILKISIILDEKIILKLLAELF